MAKFNLEKARKAQAAFLAKFGKTRGINGVGLGVSEDHSSTVLTVLVASADLQRELPTSILGVPIRFEIVDQIEALKPSEDGLTPEYNPQVVMRRR